MKPNYQYVLQQGRVVAIPEIPKTSPPTKYGKYDAVINNPKKTNYDKLDNYAAYHASKGKINRELGKK